MNNSCMKNECVPHGWETVTLSQISTINPKLEKHLDPKLEVSFIPMKCVEKLSGKFDLTNHKRFEAVKNKFTYFEDQDIIFAKITPCMQNGKIAIMNGLKNGIGYGSTEFHVIRLLDSRFLRKFYFYYLLQETFRKDMVSKMKGTAGQLRVSTNVLSNVMVPFPPFAEQKRIVAKIESIFSRIDVASGDLERIKTLLKQAKQSVLKSAFEGRLIVHDVDDKPKDFLKRISEHSNRELIFDKGDLPKGWIRAELGGLCDLIGGGTPSRKNPEYFGGNIIWLTPTEIPKEQIVKIKDSKERITQLGLKKSSAKMIPDGAVLLTSRASIGYVAISGTLVTTNQGFASFVCNKTIHNYFLAYWLYGNKDLLKSIATGTTFKEISKRKIRGLFIPLPPLNEQKRIVAKIESIFGRIDLVEKQVKMALNQLDTLKSSTLQQAFKGKLVPQNPNDEPAKILLQNIKQEQESLIKKAKNVRNVKNVK